MFTDVEFTSRYTKALGELGEQDLTVCFIHENRKGTKPRASGIGNCARQQYYSLIGAPETNLMDEAMNWPQLMGTAGQSLVSATLRQMGYTVYDEEQEVVVDDILVGHIDGMISGLDLEDKKAVFDVKLKNIWGLWGTKNSLGIISNDLKESNYEIYMQLQTYVHGKDADLGIIFACPFDMSVNRLEANKRKALVAPVYRIFSERSQDAAKLAVDRAMMLVAAARAGILPQTEFDPVTTNFPCNYCAYKALCISEGPTTGYVLPR